MAADLYIHAMPPDWTEDRIAELFSIFCHGTLGSKWFGGFYGVTEQMIMDSTMSDEDKAQMIREMSHPDLTPHQLAAVISASEMERERNAEFHKLWLAVADIIGRTDRIHIGEVSWLKAGLFEDAERYVPAPVDAVNNLIDEDYPTLDEDLKLKIREAMGLRNDTKYDVESYQGDVEQWLDAHMGCRLFTVSW